MASTPTTADPEKNIGLSFASGVSTPHGHHTGSHAKERIRHFLHPNGKRIHVASDPVEADHLRRTLSSVKAGEEHHEPFDVYIAGTPEHVEAVRHAQTHHEARRDALRAQHREAWEQFANVQGELDVLSGELNRISDHGVELDAHFDRFGYSAHIKSYDQEGGERSGATTPRRSSETSSARESDGEGKGALKLFKVPVVRQYFHKGIIWRASSEQEVQSFELFVDLLYVGIIQVNGDAASEDPTGFALLKFVITFTLSWKIWNDMSLIIAWFETDDLFQRLSILFLLSCLFGYTTNLTEAFAHTYPTLIGFFLAAKLYMVAYLALVAILVPMVRGTMLWHICNALLSTGLWIGSIHVEWPNQLALIWLALFVDIFGSNMYFWLIYGAKLIGPKAQKCVDGVFEFVPALNIEHRTERTNAFVALVFGYTVVALLYQSALNGIDSFFGKSILGLIQAFIFNWLYFEIDGSNIRVHAIRRHRISAMAWSMAHLPFIMSFILGSGALARLAIASDLPSVHIEDLTEEYQTRSEPEISPGIRWFYCAGLGLALACMGFISISHLHRDSPGLRLRKKHRLSVRFAVAIILICLPLAESLNSLQLIGTVTGLVAFTLICELWGSSCEGVKLCARDRPCKYTGFCPKKDLQRLLRQGGKLDVDELAPVDRDKGGGQASAPM